MGSKGETGRCERVGDGEQGTVRVGFGKTGSNVERFSMDKRYINGRRSGTLPN